MLTPGGQYKYITMLDAVGATGAGDAMEVIEEQVGGLSVVGIQLTGTWSATVTFQASIDGTNYVSILAENVTTGAEAATTTANGIYRITCVGLRYIRLNVTAYTSGNVTGKGYGVA